jgi:hypothetical protein
VLPLALTTVTDPASPNCTWTSFWARRLTSTWWFPEAAPEEVVADNTDWSLMLVVLLWKSARVSMPWIVVRRPDSLVFRVCRAEIFAVH